MTSGHRAGERPGPTLVREHHVTLRRQLAAGLEAAIRDGHLGPGSHLPSTRDMAHRLGVHRSTVSAAYARLRRRGCVVGGVGHRLQVAAPVDPLEKVEPPDRRRRRETRRGRPRSATDELAVSGIENLLGHAVRRGLSREAALHSLADTATRVAERATASRHRVTLFDPRPGLRAILSAELERRLSVRVEARGHLDVRRSSHAPLLVRADLAEWVGSWQGGGPDILPLHITGGTRERGFVRRMARGGLVTLVSVSHTVRQYARDLAAREFGRGVSFVAIDPSDTRAMYRSAGASRLVLFDEPSRSQIPALRAPALAVRLVTETQILALRAYLAAPPVVQEEVDRPRKP